MQFLGQEILIIFLILTSVSLMTIFYQFDGTLTDLGKFTNFAESQQYIINCEFHQVHECDTVNSTNFMETRARKAVHFPHSSWNSEKQKQISIWPRSRTAQFSQLHCDLFVDLFSCNNILYYYSPLMTLSEVQPLKFYYSIMTLVRNIL